MDYDYNKKVVKIADLQDPRTHCSKCLFVFVFFNNTKVRILDLTRFPPDSDDIQVRIDRHFLKKDSMFA